MKTIQEAKDRYNELYRLMASSNEVESMMIFGKAEQWAFARMAELSAEDAIKWVDKLESTQWLNYITRDEADAILGSIVNQDGTKGPHWDLQTVKDFINSAGGDIEEEPYYNCYAMWVTMNTLYSDHAISIAEFVSEEQIPSIIYKMSVEKLKDRDRKRFVRKYFEL